MNIYEAALRTYDANRELVGVQLDKEGYVPLAPIGHLTTRAAIEITLEPDGSFLSAKAVDKDEPKIIIPVTEISAGRTSNLAAHGICDQMGYLSGNDMRKYELYMAQLKAWLEHDEDNPFLKAVYAYVSGKTILNDLIRAGVLDANGNEPQPPEEPEKAEDGKKPKKVKAKPLKCDKDMVRWRVHLGDFYEPCWLNQELFDSWIGFYVSTLTEKKLDMITGELVPAANLHMKGVVPMNGNAKIISSADKTGFTYRGHFSEAWQALSVGYETSQKMHNALRWLVENNGTRIYVAGKDGCRTFLAWNPNNAQVFDILGNSYTSDEPIPEPIDYRRELYNKLVNNRMDGQLEESDGVVIASFDAATTGRLAITYFRELSGSDFLRRLYDWEASCCWFNGKFGVQSPSLKRLAYNAYGTQRISNGKAYMDVKDNILRPMMQRLIECRINDTEIPYDLERELANRAASPQNYDEFVWRSILWCACSVISANIYHKSGEFAMSMDLNTKDRSFQFGRLLAAMERVEMDWYRIEGNYRDTYAIKNMTDYRRRPLDIYDRINRWLETAYISRLARRAPWAVTRYRALAGEIMEIITQFPKEELNKPLDSTFLLGYDLQRNAFYKKNNEEEENKSNE